MDTQSSQRPIQQTPKTPARRPVYMDFAPRKMRRPASTQKAAQPVAQSQQLQQHSRPQASSAQKSQRTVHITRTAMPQMGTHHQTVVRHTEEKRATIIYPDADSIATETTQTSYNTHHHEEYFDADGSLGIIEDVDLENATAMEKTAAEFMKEPQPLDTEPKKKTSLFNVKSPFITTKVEKRPLSGDKPSPEAQAKKKIEYPHRTDLPKKQPVQHNDHVPTMVKTSASKGSNIRLIISIVITVILGALVGTVAYLAFFQ